MRRRARVSARIACGIFAVAVIAGCGEKSDPTKPADPIAASRANLGAAASQLSAPADDAPPPDKTGGFDGQRAFAHVAKLVAMGPRQSGTPGIVPAQEYILYELKSYGCAVASDDFHADTPAGSLAMKNIVAKISGEQSQIILLATHYDTKRLANFVGADDGGSSTGVMLELARLLCGKRGRDTVWIAFFDGEEAVGEWSDVDSVYGSRQMAARLAQSGDLKRIKAMLLADIVGSHGLRFWREAVSTKWLTDLVWGVAGRLGYGTIFLPQERSFDDDHDPFLKRGVPAVDVIRCCNDELPYWHTPQDTLDKISARSLAIVGHVFLESVHELGEKPAKP